MAKPKEFFDFSFPEQTTFLKKSGLRKKTTPEHWAFLECSKPDGLFSLHDPDRSLAANYEAEKLHIAFEQANDMNEWKSYLEKHPPSPEALAVLMLVAVGEANSERAREIADKGHEKPGGSRDKKRQILDIWASGKYSTKEECAEQECDELRVKFGKARKDLRNAPDPNPWPAKPYKKKT